MRYLDRLRAIEDKKKGASPTPTKPTEAPFVAFVGRVPARSANVEVPAANDAAALTGAAQARMARAMAYLEVHPEASRVCFADVQSDPAHIFLTVALREPWGALEVMVKRERFDAMALMELSLRYPATSIFVPVH